MLHEFLTANRDELIGRTRAKAAARATPRPTDDQLMNGIPIFLDQLSEALRLSRAGSGPAGQASAAKRGGDLLRRGFTISQVVHDYGDVCQAVTELAGDIGAPITVDEFRTLNRCLDDAIAEAVTEYARLRDSFRNDQETERLGTFAHELRNRLGTAMMAFAALKTGRVGIGGATGAVVDRSHRALRDLIDRSLVEVRIESGRQDHRRIEVSQLVEEIQIDAALEAAAAGVELAVDPVEPGLEIRGDRAIIASAAANLLQNAFKFSRAPGVVRFRARATPVQVVFEVEDECGGLPPGSIEELFVPFAQRGANRTGNGLGLSISRRGIEANGGRLSARDLPGKGCIFMIVLPRHSPSTEAPRPILARPSAPMAS